MIPEIPATQHNEDLDRADRNDKWRLAAWVLALLLVGAITWILIAQNNAANEKASSEASQKFTLAQQVAAACALKEQADDLGGLCQSATQIVKEGPSGSSGIQGPPGDIGPEGPLGPKGEQGVQGNQGVLGATGRLGLPGVAGLNGVPGASGADGASGPAGADGATGPAGADGATGPAGPEGPAGADGTDGTPGGPAGADGAPGQSAFPFTFTFKFKNDAFTCTLTAPDVIASCVAA